GGVTPSMALMDRPAACRAVVADSRPEPGPLTRTSTSLRPNLPARSAHVSAARWAANGVLFRLPLKPTVPAEAKHRVSPLVSVMVTMVLLNVALMWAMPRLTLRRCLRFLLLATVPTPLAAQNFRSLGRLRDFVKLLAAHFLDALLPGHRFAWSLAGPGVGPRPLAAHRQSAAVPEAAVTTDVLQTSDILLGLAAQRSFDRVILIQD